MNYQRNEVEATVRLAGTYLLECLPNKTKALVIPALVPFWWECRMVQPFWKEI